MMAAARETVELLGIGWHRLAIEHPSAHHKGSLRSSLLETCNCVLEQAANATDGLGVEQVMIEVEVKPRHMLAEYSPIISVTGDVEPIIERVTCRNVVRSVVA